MKTVFFTLLLFLLTSCSDSKPEATIQSFENDLNTTSIPTQRTLQINVFANYSDGSKINITDGLIWSSSDETLATVTNGLVSVQTDAGSVDINYTTQETFSDGTPIHTNTVVLDINILTLEEIRLSQSSLNISVGATTTIVAIGIFDDNSTFDITNDCNWSSSDTNVSNVELGVITGISEGNATITASDDNITSDSLELVVTTAYYTNLSIEVQKSEFNVEQTIQLTAIATTEDGDRIILENSEVTWSSDDVDVASVDDTTGIVTALTKGSVVITAKINSDNTFQDTQALEVVKDKYMRLYKDGIEVEFPHVDTNETMPQELSEFTMKAIGQDFTISELKVTDLNGFLIYSAWFDNLVNGEIVYEDENITFELMHDGSKNELHYYFKIDDAFNNEFSEKYILNQE